MTPETKQRLEALIDAMWPHGFCCERCGSRDVPVCKRRPTGWAIQCRRCSSQLSLCSQRVRVIMRCKAVVEILRDVCLVFEVPLEELLDKSRRDIVVRARSTAVKLTSEYLVAEEMCEVFRFASHKHMQAVVAKPGQTNDIWREAAEARKKEREKHERKQHRNQKCRKVEDHAADG